MDWVRMSNILYSFRRCPYAIRARMAIALSTNKCLIREVDLRDRPVHLLEVSPKGTVPVLLLADGEILEESLDIMAWALAGILSPSDDDLDLIVRNDEEFKANLDRYKYPNRFDEDYDGKVYRDAAVSFLDTLEQRLTIYQNLSGDVVGFCDIAILPFVRQFANIDREWFDSLRLPRLHEWLENHLQSQLFHSVMPKLKRWFDGDSPIIFPFETL
jgi:glutathione S-transferase